MVCQRRQSVGSSLGSVSANRWFSGRLPLLLVVSGVRRETGKEYVVQVHCDEGVATHIGPEPCGVIREGGVEASVGERAGQPLSREIHETRVPTQFCWRKATRTGAPSLAPGRPGAVGDPGMYGRSLRGNREVSLPTLDGPPSLVRIGKARSRSR